MWALLNTGNQCMVTLTSDGSLVPARPAWRAGPCDACLRWASCSVEEETRMMEGQQEAWAGGLLTVRIVGLLLGEWLLLRLAGNEP